jgi:hypothetical protein
MEKNNEELVTLLISKELEIKQMVLYIQQLETSYNDLTVKYNDLVHLHYTKVKRKQIGYKQQFKQSTK